MKQNALLVFAAITVFAGFKMLEEPYNSLTAFMLCILVGVVSACTAVILDAIQAAADKVAAALVEKQSQDAAAKQ